MTKIKDVGRSWRTYAKHELMNSLVGEEVGVVGRMSPLARHAFIDLTAGDAAAVVGSDWHRSCSPGILAYHASGAPKPSVIDLHEIQPATFDRLVGNLAHHLPELGYAQTGDCEWRLGNHVVLTAHNLSGAQVDVNFLRRIDAAFVLNDPNAITEWAMRDTFAQEVKAAGCWAHRSLSTLGCNPAGLKRIDREERQLWFDSIESEQSSSPYYRDMLLAAIERDDAQWAYLISTAGKWRSRTESVVRTAFKKAGRTASMAWARDESAEFEKLKRVLFLTATERTEAAHLKLPFEVA